MNEELIPLIKTLIANIEPVLGKASLSDMTIRRNIIVSLEKIRDIKEILKEEPCQRSSKKFKQSRLFNFWL